MKSALQYVFVSSLVWGLYLFVYLVGVGFYPRVWPVFILGRGLWSVFIYFCGLELFCSLVWGL